MAGNTGVRRTLEKCKIRRGKALNILKVVIGAEIESIDDTGGAKGIRTTEGIAVLLIDDPTLGLYSPYADMTIKTKIIRRIVRSGRIIAKIVGKERKGRRISTYRCRFCPANTCMLLMTMPTIGPGIPQ